MKKDIVRQVLTIFVILATLVVNGLANALPLNGLMTGEISDRFKVYFVPAGYVFSIWGLIYLGLIVFGIYQVLPSQRENPRLRRIAPWFYLGGAANIAWLFLWHYEQFVLTLPAMLILLGSLIMIYLSLGIGKTAAPSAGEKWLVRLPFSIYLGWVTVATVANVTSLLDFLKWDGFGLTPESWMVIVLAAVFAIVAAVQFTRRDVAYTAVILWALAGIAFKHAGVAPVAIATWATFALVTLSLGAAFLVRRRGTAPA
jgi:hypothetical protein